MKKTDDTKKQRILDAATELFGSKPFHKVLLSEVARLARVGKGTLYLYFENKDELYLAVLFREFAGLVKRLQVQLAEDHTPADEQIRSVVQAISEHLFAKAVSVEMMRGAVINCPKNGEWYELRLELRTLIQKIIERGIKTGMFEDSDPRFTAQYIPGLIRSIYLFSPEGANAEKTAAHASNFILKGLKKTA